MGHIIYFVKNLTEKLREKFQTTSLMEKENRDDPVCSCSRSNESAAHYFFECHHYEEQRIQLFTDTREFHPLNVHMLLKGKDPLSDSDNSKLF